jgi:protein-tyrosine phosphatase
VSDLLVKNGYDSKNHRARKADGHLISSADLILVMENSHKNAIMTHYPGASGKIMLLGKWSDNTEIQDPYKKSLEAHMRVFEQIENSCLSWYERLKDS